MPINLLPILLDLRNSTGMYVPFVDVNRIQGKVAYMLPLNYWLRCRPVISRNIVSQIE